MPAYKIPLNASNYVSPERKQAFQEALEDDHQVAGTGSERVSEAENGPQESRPSGGQPASSAVPSPLLESVTAGMAKFYDHQNRTLEIHEQYLQQQGQFADLFSQVLQHQENVLGNAENGNAAQLVESLHRSLENFHQLQDRGLQVHQQFLKQAAANSQSFVNLLEKQHGWMENGKMTSPDRLTGEDPNSRPTAQGSGALEAQQQAASDPKPADSRPESARSRPEPGPSREPEQPAAPSAPAVSAVSAFSAVSAVSAEELTRSLLEIVAEKTGYPAEMLELEMDMEADLGIDSIKRVEILGALEDRYPELPQPDTDALAELRTLGEVVDFMDSEAADVPEPTPISAQTPEPAPQPLESPSPPAHTDSGSSPTLEQLTGLLLDVVAEKTGYPAEMLELEMDMEADLGIDSIKRVEILGAMEDQVPELPPFETDTLAELRTLGEIVEVMSQTPDPSPAEPTAQTGIKKKAPEQTLTVNPVRERPLAPPDHYPFSIAKDRPLVVTDDGSAFTRQLAGMLSSTGWKVVLWGFPEDLIRGKNGVGINDLDRVHQQKKDLESLKSAWKELVDDYGSPIGLIHLHPDPAGLEDFHLRERELIKQVFFLAGLFDEGSAGPQPGERSLFMTVTREDGRLGTAGLRDHFHESTGFPGLIKTLRWEWPDVFCRAVDLDPGLDLEEQTAAVLTEIHDPDRGLSEVGVNPNGRMTLEKDKPL